MLCIFSALVGWILGIVITPASTGEKNRFSEYGKALTAAATGFFAGRINDIIAFLSKFFELQTPIISAISGLLAGCCFLLGLLFTFIFRSYVGGSIAERRAKRAKATAEVHEALSKLASVDGNEA